MRPSFANILSLILVILSLNSCVFENVVTCPKEEPVVTAKNVYINMSVGVASAVANAKSRVGEQDEENSTSDFEGPESKYERMNTLRVVIVRGARFDTSDGVKDSTGYVEHNHLFKFNDGGIVLFDDMIFKVSGGEKKKIYLIANENYLVSQGIDLDVLKVKSEYPDDYLESLKLSTSQPGTPLIDNSSESVDKFYIPMSEVFELDVPTPQNPEDYEISKSYFVTRAAVKFSFNINTTSDYPSDDSGLRIKNITVNSIGNTEFFLPRATYSPDKYSESSLTDNGRFITEYTLPTNPAPENKSYVFTSGLEDLVLDYTDDNKGIHPFVPNLYFPETGLTQYSVSITIGDKDSNANDYTFNAVPLNNLSSLPRNTHVLVNITLGLSEISAVVKLVPYIGVNLDYTFGFEQLIPWGRPNNPDAQPVE